MTTLSDTLRPKRPSEGSFAFSSNCLSFEAKPLVAGQFICVSYWRMKSNFLSSDYRCSQGFLIRDVVGGAVFNQRAQQESEGDMEPTVLFENEKVRVIRHVVRPGERNELKERNDRVQYFFTSCFIRYNHLDGRVEEIKHEAGKVYFRKADHMWRENIGETENEHLAVMLK